MTLGSPAQLTEVLRAAALAREHDQCWVDTPRGGSSSRLSLARLGLEPARGVARDEDVRRLDADHRVELLLHLRPNEKQICSSPETKRKTKRKRSSPETKPSRTNDRALDCDGAALEARRRSWFVAAPAPKRAAEEEDSDEEDAPPPPSASSAPRAAPPPPSMMRTSNSAGSARDHSAASDTSVLTRARARRGRTASTDDAASAAAGRRASAAIASAREHPAAPPPSALRGAVPSSRVVDPRRRTGANERDDCSSPWPIPTRLKAQRSAGVIGMVWSRRDHYAVPSSFDTPARRLDLFRFQSCCV